MDYSAGNAFVNIKQSNARIEELYGLLEDEVAAVRARETWRVQLARAHIFWKRRQIVAFTLTHSLTTRTTTIILTLTPTLTLTLSLSLTQSTHVHMHGAPNPPPSSHVRAPVPITVEHAGEVCASVEHAGEVRASVEHAGEGPREA